MESDFSAGSVRERLDALADPKILAVNERHGDDHAVNLTRLRALAKEIGRNPELARQLWASGASDARLLAILILRPSDLSERELDAMLREARRPKVQDWLVGTLAKKSKHAEALRLGWFADPDPVVASAGWALTSDRVAKRSGGLDLEGLLDTIEREMAAAPERLQWAQNQTLAEIGIAYPEHRERAIAIGERLRVLADYPTPPGCTSPFAPTWIAEIVRRREGEGNGAGE